MLGSVIAALRWSEDNQPLWLHNREAPASQIAHIHNPTSKDIAEVLPLLQHRSVLLTGLKGEEKLEFTAEGLSEFIDTDVIQDIQGRRWLSYYKRVLTWFPISRSGFTEWKH